MAQVKRAVLVILVLAAVAVAPATAKASSPCRDRIYNDWYADGKIATTYPVACYRDALKHVKGDALIYSSLSDDIRAALQGALAKAKGDTKVPAEIGNTGPAAKPHSEHRSTSSSAPHDPAPEQQQVNTTLPTPSTIAAGATTGGNSGVPVPLLVLGGLALLLTAVGGIGVVAKRRRL
jgi:hypothetical protein